MMLKGRIDYVLMRNKTLEWYKKSTATGDQVHSFRVEDAAPYSIGYVACPNTEFGRQVIDKINRILIEVRDTARYRTIQERWVPSNQLDYFRQLYAKEILNKYTAPE